VIANIQTTLGGDDIRINLLEDKNADQDSEIFGLNASVTSLLNNTTTRKMGREYLTWFTGPILRFNIAMVSYSPTPGFSGDYYDVWPGL